MSATVGDYDIVGRLGGGAMATVYRARHRRSGATVALKMVKAASEDQLRSLRREIHGLARLRHPGIVRIVDQGAHEGMPWLAMDIVDGVTLGEYQQRTVRTARARDGRPGPHPTSLREMLTIIRRVCFPLAYLHGEGFVHRDLKPENIVVKPGGVPVIVDFGLVTAFAPASGHENLESAARAAGTALYMCPEQIRGDFVDARADLYALGCILVEVLSGRPPFTGRRVAEIHQRHLNDPPEPLSARIPFVPARLDELVARLLAKDPKRRLGHASDVADVLAELGADGHDVYPGAPAGRTYLYLPGLAGRDAELQRVRQELHRLHERTSAGRLLVMVGESGIGKTRLAIEAGREAELMGVTVLAGRASERSPSALGSLRGPLAALADHCFAAGRETSERVFGSRGAVLSRFAPMIRNLPGQELHAEPAELIGQAARLRVLSFLCESLATFAAARPVLIILDDLQWADDLSLAFVAHAATSGLLGERPIGILALTLPSPGIIDALGALGDDAVDWLVLNRLGAEAIAAIAGDMLALEPPPLLAAHLHQQCAGNPFFAAQLLAAAVESGLLWRDAAGNWNVGPPAGGPATADDFRALPLPRSLWGLLRRRLLELSADSGLVVSAAAVLGLEPAVLLVWEMTGLDDSSFLAAMDELVARHILEEAPRGIVRFVHSQMRAVAYNALEQSDRARLHGLAAESLGRLHPEHLEEARAAMAKHWEGAGALGSAAREHVLAAEQAAAQCAYAQAALHARHALRLQPSCAARLSLAEALFCLAQFAAALPEARAVEGDPASTAEERTRARLVVAAIDERQGDFASSLDVARKCEQEAPEGLSRLRARHQQGRALMWLCRFEQALGVFESVRTEVESRLAAADDAAADRGLRQLLAGILAGKGVVLDDLGEYDAALVSLREAERLFGAIGDLRGLASTQNNVASVCFRRGEYEEALRCFRESLEIKRKTGDRRGIAVGLGNVGAVQADLGSFEAAMSSFQESLAIKREIGDRQGTASTLHNLALVHGELGAWDEAFACYGEALALAREIGDRRTEADALRDWGLARVEVRGELSNGLKALDESVFVATAEGLRGERAEGRLARARGRFAGGDGTGAREDAEAALADFQALRRVDMAALALALLARLRAAVGEIGAALALLKQAGAEGASGLKIASRLRFAEDRAALLKAAGSVEEGAAVAQQALAIAAEKGARTAAARLTRLLEPLPPPAR
ncbi:MAG: protein kinase [Candidatus Schekmanbacteria bacterium]|nr:protein kinase [Candidatus Schekmanbacteria bacterium]